MLPFNKDKDLFIAKLKNRNKKDFYDPDYIAYIVHSKGNRVSKEFHVIDALKGGMAKVARKGVMGKMNYGFIDDMGKIVVPVEYLTLSDFEDGFAYGTKLTGSCGCTRHTQYRIDQNGKAEVCINNRFIERRQFNCCQDLVEVTIPEAAWIGEGAFAGCRNLKIIHIPENVKKIDKYAFQGCTALTDIVFPPHLEEICDGVLSGCESLKNIVIPDSVIVLDNAFAQCNSLKTIKIPSSVRTINSGGGLDCCKKLESINVSPQNKNYTSIDGVLYDKAMERIVAFPQNAPIKDYVIPIKSRYFGYTFFECYKLERIVLPESVRSVGNFISNRCERLREVVLPESLQKIDRELFYCCPNLKNIVLSKNLYTSSLRFLPKGINYQFR